MDWSWQYVLSHSRFQRFSSSLLDAWRFSIFDGQYCFSIRNLFYTYIYIHINLLFYDKLKHLYNVKSEKSQMPDLLPFNTVNGSHTLTNKGGQVLNLSPFWRFDSHYFQLYIFRDPLFKNFCRKWSKKFGWIPIFHYSIDNEQ